MKTLFLSNAWLLLAAAIVIGFTASTQAETSAAEKEKDETTQRLKARIEELEKTNRELQAKLDELNNPLSIAAVADWKLVQALQGASLFAQNDERTFLGVLDFTGRDLNSIFNEIGLHGSSVGIESIWNDVGFYGSQVGLYSARNEVCINPPVIVKNKRIIGHLTVNPVAISPARVDPKHLLYLARLTQGKK